MEDYLVRISSTIFSGEHNVVHLWPRDKITADLFADLTFVTRLKRTERIIRLEDDDGRRYGRVYDLRRKGRRRVCSCGCSTIRAISGFNFRVSFSNGSSRLSGIRNAARRVTGRAPGRVTTPQRTPRTSWIHAANSSAFPIVADNKSIRMRGGVRMIASSQTWPRSSSAR